MRRHVTVGVVVATAVALGAVWFVLARGDLPLLPVTAGNPATRATAAKQTLPATTRIVQRGDRIAVATAPPDVTTLSHAVDDPIARHYSIRLRVLDRDTGRELTGVLVIANPELPAEDPADANLFARGDSPLQLPDQLVNDEDPLDLFVRARGYAWQRLVVQGPWDRDVWLSRAGSIEVTVPSLPENTPAVVRVRRVFDRARKPDGVSTGRWQRMLRVGGDVVREAMAVVGTPIRLLHLAVASYVVTLELGTQDEPLVLAQSTIDVADGATCRVKLAASPSALPLRIAVTGTLHVPEGWPRARFVTVRPTSDANAWNYNRDSLRSDDPGRMGWGPLQLVPGHYEILVDPLEYVFTADIGPGPTQHLDIVLPPPMTVRVRVVDDETGNLVPDCNIHGAGQWPLNWDSDNKVDPRGIIRLLPGRHHLSTWPDEAVFCPVEIDVDIDPGAVNVPDIVMRAPRVSGVAVTLREGGALLPWDPSWRLDLIDSSGISGRGGWISDGRITSRGPGSYSLLVEDVDGYEPIPPQSVTLARGGWTKIEIPVRRKP